MKPMNAVDLHGEFQHLSAMIFFQRKMLKPWSRDHLALSNRLSLGLLLKSGWDKEGMLSWLAMEPWNKKRYRWFVSRLTAKTKHDRECPRQSSAPSSSSSSSSGTGLWNRAGIKTVRSSEKTCYWIELTSPSDLAQLEPIFGND